MKDEFPEELSRFLSEHWESLDNDVDELEKAKSKVRMDFGLGAPQPERVTIQVLQQLIKEKPERMCSAIRHWLRPDSR